MKQKAKAKEKLTRIKIYKLENGIKIPEPVQPRGDGKPTKVAMTLSAMAPGQSFLIGDELLAMKASKVVMDRNGREKSKPDGRQFVTRRIKRGLRVWRVK